MEKHSLNKGYHNPTYAATFTLTDVGVEIPWSVLSHFNIVTYLKSENIIVVENKDNTDDARIISTKEKNDVKGIIKKFVTNNIQSKPVQFQSTLAFKLLLVNNKLNQNVKVFLQCLCKESVLLYVDIKSQMCYLYSHVKNDFFLNLHQLIECAIVEMVYTKSEIENMHAYIERWERAAKLISCCESEFATKFVATCDVLDDLDRNAIYEHFVQVSLNEIELLKSQELDNHLINLSKPLSVTVVGLEKQAKLLILKGTKKSVRELMSKWRNMYIQLETLFNVPVSKVHFMNNELQKVSDGNSFSVDITVNAPKQEADVGEKVIASWLNYEGQGIYLVKGDLLALHVDTIIILTTTVLFPLFQAKGFRDDSHLSIRGTKFPIGHVFFSGNTPERCLVAVQDASKRRDDATWDDQLRSCFKNAFKQIAEKGFSKVAIHASVIDEKNVPYFLETFVETSVQKNFVSYICCQSFEEIVPTHNVIQQSLRLGPHNLRRNLRFDNVQGFLKIAVEIREGSIVEQKADVLVNTVDKSLDLQIGQLSKLFYDKAGKEIEDECKQLHPKGLQFWQCAVTGAGLLKKNGVHQILHCALPDFNKTQFEKDIRQMVKLCLLNADLEASKSIAFPSLGMGTLGYPISETQYAMLQAVEEYQFEAVSSNIETVIFVVFEKNKEEENKNYEHFLKNRSALFPEHNMKRKRELLTVGFHKIAVKIRKGSIVEQQVEVLVNTADTSLDLNKGQVSKLIYVHCGKRIQDECHKSCPKGLPQRNCTVTSAGDLAKIGVKRIVHCVLPVFNKTVFEKDVKDLVKLCLMHADKESCKSIAFPSIGMGKLGYPVLETKYAMLQAVEEYQYEAACSTLETVVFVVLEEDMYEQYLRIQGDGFQPKNKSVLDVGFPGISKVIDTVKIHVTSSLVKNCLPVSAIIFNVTVDDNVGEVDVRLARGHIVLPSSPIHITVKHAIEMCIEAKVMDVVFCICKGTNDTVGSILSAVETSNKKGHLRTVYILLTEQELLEKAQNNYYAWYLLFTGWTKTKDQNLQCSMRVMALKEEADDVFSKCQQILSPKESKQDTGHVSDYEDSYELVEDPKKHENNMELSAQINPGIIKYLSNTGALDTWLSAVKKAFGLFVKPQESSQLMVCGTMANVTSFEQYLLTGFPNSPLKSSYVNTAESRVTDKTNELSMQGTNSENNVIKNYEFGEFTVSICHGDIADCSEECIISATHEEKKNSDVAERLFKKGGQKYIEACEKLEQYGPMYVTECRVSDGGNLKCKKVIHVCIPKFDKVHQPTLNLLEDAILNCLETAGAYGLSTVAMPAVGTGSGALSAKLSLQQISRAIHHYLKEKKRLVTHVTIVILPQKTSESFMIESKCDAKTRYIPTIPIASFRKILVYLKPIILKMSIDAKVVYTKTNQDYPLVIPAGDDYSWKMDKFDCKFIMQVNMPIWKPVEKADITQFETEIFCKTEQLMQEINARKWKSVALPLFCENDNQDSFQPPLRRICRAMIRGFMSVEKCKNITYLHLYIISSNNDYLEIFYDLLKNEI